MKKSTQTPDNSQIETAKRLLLKHPVVQELSDLFEKAERQLYIVGGSVRDALLGKLHEDFDFTTDASPDEIQRIVGDWAEAIWLIGIRFGTLALRKDEHQIEITTFRQEVYPENSRHPIVKFSAEIEADLSRRDFTFNAMAVKLPEGKFVDPFGGWKDLILKQLKTPLSPEQSFLDDPLRMLRAVRFTSTIEVMPTQEVIKAIKELRERLKIVSRERIRDEFSKLLVGARPALGLKLMVESSLASEVLPDLLKLIHESDPIHRHKDLLTHTLAVIERTPPDLIVRLAALLHDIGKPETMTIEEGEVHFYHHETVGAKIAKRCLKMLKYPNKIIEDVKQLILLHMRFLTYPMGWTDKAVRKYVRDAGPLLKELNALVRADCTSQIPGRAERFAEYLQELEERIVRLEAEEESAKIRPPLDGHEIMEFLGIPPGPQVGEILRALLEVKLEGTVETKEEAYEFLRRWAK